MSETAVLVIAFLGTLFIGFLAGFVACALVSEDQYFYADYEAEFGPFDETVHGIREHVRILEPPYKHLEEPPYDQDADD